MEKWEMMIAEEEVLTSLLKKKKRNMIKGVENMKESLKIKKPKING